MFYLSLVFMALFKTCTKHSAAPPLDDGWYGAEQMCFTPLLFRKLAIKFLRLQLWPIVRDELRWSPYAANNLLYIYSGLAWKLNEIPPQLCERVRVSAHACSVNLGNECTIPVVSSWRQSSPTRIGRNVFQQIKRSWKQISIGSQSWMRR